MKPVYNIGDIVIINSKVAHTENRSSMIGQISKVIDIVKPSCGIVLYVLEKFLGRYFSGSVLDLYNY